MEFHFESDISSLFLLESDHMPLQTHHFDLSLRQKLISLISQYSCNLDPFLSYLAINYVDRFLSCQEIPESKSWVFHLVAISCISLAAQMQETEFEFTDLQGDGGIIFDIQSIKRMEILILGALKWRMRSITPFSFISFFISLFKLKDPPLLQALKARASDIIFKAQKEMKFTIFRPSVIAASAILLASHELIPFQYPCYKEEIWKSFEHENLSECYKVMEEMEKEVGWRSDTPVNVLDVQFWSSESEKTNVISSMEKNEEEDEESLI